jgi:hypothetical protein
MSKTVKSWGIIALLAFIFACILPLTVQAQLVVENMRVKIVKVDRPLNRLEVRVHDGGNTNIQYVLIDGNTKFSSKNKIITQNQAWNEFKPDMIVRVKGGMTWDLKLKAKTIYW